MSTAVKTGFAAILFLAISCTKENTFIKSSTSEQSVNNTLKFKIGQRYGGGIIFYIDSTGEHGLIADTVDLTKSVAWWNGVYIKTGATGTKIGKGQANTRKIIIIQGKPGKYAALKCANYKAVDIWIGFYHQKMS